MPEKTQFDSNNAASDQLEDQKVPWHADFINFQQATESIIRSPEKLIKAATDYIIASKLNATQQSWEALLLEVKEEINSLGSLAGQILEDDSSLMLTTDEMSQAFQRLRSRELSAIKIPFAILGPSSQTLVTWSLLEIDKEVFNYQDLEEVLGKGAKNSNERNPQLLTLLERSIMGGMQDSDLVKRFQSKDGPLKRKDGLSEEEMNPLQKYILNKIRDNPELKSNLDQIQDKRKRQLIDDSSYTIAELERLMKIQVKQLGIKLGQTLEQSNATYYDESSERFNETQKAYQREHDQRNKDWELAVVRLRQWFPLGHEAHSSLANLLKIKSVSLTPKPDFQLEEFKEKIGNEKNFLIEAVQQEYLKELVGQYFDEADEEEEKTTQVLKTEVKNKLNLPNVNQEITEDVQQQVQTVKAYVTNLEKSLAKIEITFQQLESYLKHAPNTQEGFQYWGKQIQMLNNLSTNSVAKANKISSSQMDEFVRRPQTSLAILETSLSFIDHHLAVLTHWKKNGRDFPRLKDGWVNLRQQCAVTLRTSTIDTFKGILNWIIQEKKKVNDMSVNPGNIDLYNKHLENLLQEIVHANQQWQQGRISIISTSFDAWQRRFHELSQASKIVSPTRRAHDDNPQLLNAKTSNESIENKRGTKRSFKDANSETEGALMLLGLFATKSLFINDAEPEERYSGLRIVDKMEDGKYRAVKNGANIDAANHLNVVLINPALLSDEERKRFDEVIKRNAGKRKLKLSQCPIQPPITCKGTNELANQIDELDGLAPSPKKRKSISH